MSYEESLCSITVPANADLSASQYCFVKLVDNSGTGRAALTGDGEFGIGVLQNKPSAADVACTVGFKGVSKVKAGGAVTAGVPIASDASGQAVSAASGDIVLGLPLKSGVSGDIIPVLLDARNAYANNITT